MYKEIDSKIETIKFKCFKVHCFNMKDLLKRIKIYKARLPEEIGTRPSEYEKFGKHQRVLYGLECAQD